MAAERGGPAQRDRRHDAALYPAEMAIVRLGVGRAMAAEDIRHLQGRAHGAASGWRHHLDAQAIERALRLRDRRRRHMCVARRRRQGNRPA
jgi:hypothetical protein